MNIYEKLNEIHKQVGYIQKGQQGKQYQYVGSSDVLAVVRQHMNEQGLILLPSIKNATVKEYETKTGTLQIFTELIMTMTWINTEKPEEKIEIDWYAQGMDLAGEKGVGKALTYGEKYFLLKFFNIATDKDDPDSFQERVNANKPEPKPTKEQLEELGNLLKELDAISDSEDAGKKAMRSLLETLEVDAFEKSTRNAIDGAINKTKKWIETTKKKKVS
jgi:hypothetical protein